MSPSEQLEEVSAAIKCANAKLEHLSKELTRRADQEEVSLKAPPHKLLKRDLGAIREAVTMKLRKQMVDLVLANATENQKVSKFLKLQDGCHIDRYTREHITDMWGKRKQSGQKILTSQLCEYLWTAITKRT